MTMFFAEAYHLYFIESAVDSYGFCTTTIAVGLFFGCSGDHWTSERLAGGLKALKCGGDLFEMLVVLGH